MQKYIIELRKEIIKNMKDFKLTDEEIKLIEKWSGKKFNTEENSTNKKSNSKRTKKDKNLTKGEKLDLYFKDKILDKEDLTPEELDDLLSPEEEWDDYE